MKYSDVRDEIKTGDILAWSDGSWTNFHQIQLNLVRIFTRSEYNHVGIAWVVGGRVFVIESVVPKIRIVPLSMLLPCYHIAINNDVTEDELLRTVGGKYSKIEAIRGFMNDEMLPESDNWQCAKHIQIIHSKYNSAWVYCKSTPSAVVKFALYKLDGRMRYLE